MSFPPSTTHYILTQVSSDLPKAACQPKKPSNMDWDYDQSEDVYTMKKARKMKLHTLNPLLPGGGGQTELGIDQQDDDSDSGISQVYNPVSTYRRAQFSLPDIAKTELASKLLAATPAHPAHIKARVLWRYNAVERTDLQVEKGEIILLLYREKSKVYAVNNKGKSGFIPFNYCTVLRKNDFVSNVYHPQSERTNYEKCSWQTNGCHHEFVDASYYSRTVTSTNSHIHRSRSEESLCSHNDCESLSRKISSSLEDLSDDNRIATMMSDLINWDRKAPETYRRRQKVQVSHFRKFENESVMVLFDFHAADENDVDVQRGEVVTVFNRDDQDWWWVMRDDGLEGFIPSSYVSIEAVRMSPECTPRSTDSSVGSSEGSINQVRFQDPLCTIHSYEIEHSDSDSVGPHETHDSDDEEMYMDSKWSTWC